MPLFVFAYGSLIFRPSRFFGARRPALVRGVRRAFRQASPDHRGTPSDPGRVVTLLREEGATCAGVVYEVADADVDAVLVELDDRESGGYERARLSAEVPGEAAPVPALTWIAGPDNPHHMPPAPLAEVARVVLRARGQSGANIDYVLRLADALRGLGVSDPEVFALEAAVLAGVPSRVEAAPDR
ncbi:MAG: gamma-glutamylcyclotransferase [Polyangiaceae bacterium]